MKYATFRGIVERLDIFEIDNLRLKKLFEDNGKGSTEIIYGQHKFKVDYVTNFQHLTLFADLECKMSDIFVRPYSPRTHYDHPEDLYIEALRTYRSWVVESLKEDLQKSLRRNSRDAALVLEQIEPDLNKPIVANLSVHTPHNSCEDIKILLGASVTEPTLYARIGENNQTWKGDSEHYSQTLTQTTLHLSGILYRRGVK